MYSRILNTDLKDESVSSWNGQTGHVVSNEQDYSMYYAPKSNSIVLVNTVGDFGIIDPTKIYFIDSVVDVGNTPLFIPSGGINITGHTFNISKLVSSQTSFTLLNSPVGGSGNFNCSNVAFEITGASSQVFDIHSETSNEAFEMDTVNFNNCNSLGTIDNYRQGLERNTGRFGGFPNLILKGAWSGGYFIESSIVRGLDSSFSGSLYEAGASFVMQSRFRSNQNIDLPPLASFVDFTETSFPNPSTLQLTGGILSRSSTIDPTDANIVPNISHASTSAAFTNNIGLMNTFVGARINITSEAVTTISTIDTYVPIAGTWSVVPAKMQHFDSPSSGVVKHLGGSPIEFRIICDLIIDGKANDVLHVKIVLYDSKSMSYSDSDIYTRQINNFSGGRDVAFFNIVSDIHLAQNDTVHLEISNSSGTDNVTCDLNSYLIVDTL